MLVSVSRLAALLCDEYSSIFTVLSSDSVRWCPSITITCLTFELGNDSRQPSGFSSTNAVAVMLKGDRRKRSDYGKPKLGTHTPMQSRTHKLSISVTIHCLPSPLCTERREIGAEGLCGQNSALERRFSVRVQSLLLFLLSSFP